MKMLKYLFAALLCAGAVTACSDDDWGNDNAEMAHVYYFGPEVWGYDNIKKGNANVVHYEVKQGETVAIPMQFWSEYVRSYDVTSFYYTTPKPQNETYYPNLTTSSTVKYTGPDLVRGVDYEIVDAEGRTISPAADGAFAMEWPQAKKGVQNIYVRALSGGQKGSFNLQTFDPNSDVELTNQDVSTTIQAKTNDYEVRIFTQNYRITVTIE